VRSFFRTPAGRRIAGLVHAALLVLACGLAGCAAPPAPETEKTPLVVFAAGSLILPFAHLEEAFEKARPDIDVRAEYHGSIQVIRHATELHEPIDVVATADAALIPMLMIDSVDPETGAPYAGWAIRFAGNRLALAYRQASLYADEITPETWVDVLTRPEVKVGLADPRFDASGYRALMAFALAQDLYDDPTLFHRMYGDQFTYPIGIFRQDDLTTISVPEIVETRPDSHVIVRGGSIQLLALLESGDLDYAFEYESVIQQHGLKMFRLPAEVNLGEQALDPLYRTVQVNLDFQRFATVTPRFRGERIGYGITIPSTAPHPEAAAAFIAFLLGPEGHALMAADHHPLFDPPLAAPLSALPGTLQALCAPDGSP
jgi:molybdate/tungstate transport system substrate-binding protein